MVRSESASTAEDRKRERSSKRPPIATIVLLVFFLLTILAFITLRQQQTTEDQKLRLLAGLASQVETALPDRAGRMIDVIQGQCELSEIRRYLRELPDLTLVHPGPGDSGFERAADSLDEGDPAVALQAVGNEVYVSYSGPAFVGSAAIVPASDSREASPEDYCPPSSQIERARLLASLDLHHVVEPIIIPEAFDTMLIADRDGKVLFQRGSRELRLNDISRLLEQIDRDAGLFGLGHLFGVEAGEDPSQPGGLHTVVDGVRLANSDYRLFLQPIEISLPALPGERAPQPTSWMAIGLVSEERLLSASFTTSPLLLFLLVAVFPAALVSWPFLKLRYISPRQRFHRLDAVALIFAALFGTSLAAFLLFDGLFVARLNSEVDHHLETLSDSLLRNFRFEMFDAYHQLLAIESAGDFSVSETPDLAAVRTVLAERFALPTGQCRNEGTALSENDESKVAPTYPYFHSLFWVDSDGGQHDKLSLRRYALLTNHVPERRYFTRLYDRASKSTAETFPHRGQQRFVLDMTSDEECSRYLSSRAPEDGRSQEEVAAWRAEQAAQICDEPVRAAFSPLRSMTSGEDLLVVSIPSSPQPVAVLYGKPVSLGFPILPDGYGFAVLDREGRVLFHSDPRRSLNENLLKAVDRSALLGSLIESQRSAHLVANYWGQRHRMHVTPLPDLPWSLIVFRHSRDLRMRNFELTYDFANPFLLYTLFLNLFVMALILVLRRWHLHRFLWPGARFGSAYRFLTLFCLLATLGTAVAVACVDAGLLPVSLLVWLAFLVPLATLAFATLALACASRLSRWVRADTDRQKRLEQALFAVSGLLFFVVLAPQLGQFAEHRRAPSLLPAALVFAVAVWMVSWRHRRHSFVGRRRMKAYISTLTCVIFVLAILPAVLLFEAAASRQVQLLVQETQIQQAQAIQQQRERLQDARDEIDCPSLFAGYSPVVRAIRADYLSGIFDTETAPAPGVSMSTTGSSLWHHHCADDQDTPGLAQRLVSARPFPLNDLSSATTGVDLSRHPRHGCSWSVGDEERDGHSVLTGTLPSVWGAPVTLRSTLFEPLSFERLGIPYWIGFPIACLLVFVMPRWLSNVIARKVLLVPLASVERGRIQKLLSHAATDSGARNDGDEPAHFQDKPNKILLVTSVPDLALDTLAEEGLGDETLDSLYKVYTLDRLVDEFEGKIEEKHHTPQLVDFRQSVRQQEGARSVLLVRFTPELKKPAMAERQIEALKYVAEDERRTLVILSRFSIHALREEAEAVDRRADKEVDRRLLRRWIAFLGSFVVRYGKDVTETQENAFRKAIERRGWIEARRFLKGDWSPSEIRETLALLDLIYSDCSITRHLQHVGYEILSEIEFESATQVQVLNQIAFLARPYYQAIWENCSTDERVVLAQLALDGLVNPDNLGWVLDLMQKGLVQREKSKEELQGEMLKLPRPRRCRGLLQKRGFRKLGRWLGTFWPTEPAPSTALRLMNRSFARFVRQQVERVQLLEWEEEEGTSTWSVLRWLLPIPLLLLGGFLFITQRDAVSNMVGVLVAIASLTPTLVTVFDHFRHLADRRALAERRRGSAADGL